MPRKDSNVRIREIFAKKLQLFASEDIYRSGSGIVPFVYGAIVWSRSIAEPEYPRP